METLIFAILSIYLFYRLWTVLGTRTGHENERDYHFSDDEKTDNVVVMPKAKKTDGATESTPESRHFDHIKKIQKIDKSFDEAQFLAGAERAHAMIVTAFSKGDLEKLQKLLANNVFVKFQMAVEDRIKDGYSLETSIDEMYDIQLQSVNLNESIAQLGVRFITEQTAITTDAEGHILDNPARLSRKLDELWTFERDLKSGDPIWRLIRTQIN